LPVKIPPNNVKENDLAFNKNEQLYYYQIKFSLYEI